jgi:hypothetical protein
MSNGPSRYRGGVTSSNSQHGNFERANVTPRPGNTNTGGGGGGGFKLGGGLLGGLASMFAAKRAEKIARENREWQEKQNTIAYERSLPWSSFGPAGSVEFDPETKQMLQNLNPEYQAMMQGFIGSSAMAGEELQMMYSDPNKMARDQFNMLQEFSADDYAKSRMQGQEAAIARGMQGTESYYDKMAIEDSINKSILGDKISSVGLGMDYRNMLSAEYLNTAKGARDTAGMLLPNAQLGADIGRFSHTGKNMQGIREGGQDYADTQSGFWSGMMDQKAKYNQQGNVTQEAEPGWLSQLIGGGKQFFSLLS